MKRELGPWGPLGCFVSMGKMRWHPHQKERLDSCGLIAQLPTQMAPQTGPGSAWGLWSLFVQCLPKVPRETASLGVSIDHNFQNLDKSILNASLWH